MTTPVNPKAQERALTIFVAFLAGAVVAELLLSVRSQSQTWDEAYHLLAGYRYWQAADYGINPEHPPLVKLLAGATLLPQRPNLPQIPQGTSKVEAFTAAHRFLYSNQADKLLFRARLAASFFCLVLALLLFEVTYRMFGRGPAVLAMVLGVFEPNILAHGALITTDVALSCLLLAAVYAFYRYLQQPSVWRILTLGIITGLTLAAKHSGILVFPILGALALAELIRGPRQQIAQGPSPHAVPRQEKLTARQLAGCLVIASLIGLLVLWSFYSFRFRARPGNLQMTPPLAGYIKGGVTPGLRSPMLSRLLLGAAHWGLLPESYLYGLADVFIVSGGPRPSYLFGKLYPRGQWFYFPATFVIKSTLGFLGLLALTMGVLASRRLRLCREVAFMALPPTIFFAISLTSDLNIGVRHILPIYPFLIILIAAAAWSVCAVRRRWAYVVAGLVAWHTVSSLRAFPDYLAYSNELWGGPSKTYRVLSDTNVDWGQGLIEAKEYLDAHHVRDCWMAYFGSADPDYYRIPCQRLPDVFEAWWGKPVVVTPSTVDGTILVSATQMAGVYSGPGELNPYEQFLHTPPLDSIGGSMLVFQGTFDMSIASRTSRLNKAWKLFAERQLEPAIAEARAVVQEAPRMVYAHYTLGFLLAQAGQKQEAKEEYETALTLAKTVYPEYQWYWVRILESELSGL